MEEEGGLVVWEVEGGCCGVEVEEWCCGVEVEGVVLWGGSGGVVWEWGGSGVGGGGGTKEWETESSLPWKCLHADVDSGAFQFMYKTHHGLTIMCEKEKGNRNQF